MASTERTPFGTAFWCAYVANTTLMVAVSLMFRYSDFVTHLGGTEYELGWIVGIGMIGALMMRVLQGAGIDRYGAGNIWLLSVGLVLFSLLAHLTVTRIDTPYVYVIRMLYTISLAGAFGSSITFISLRAPAHRTGEAIGALGSSGFVGMAVGPVIADAIFDSQTSKPKTFDNCFNGHPSWPCALWPRRRWHAHSRVPSDGRRAAARRCGGSSADTTRASSC